MLDHRAEVLALRLRKPATKTGWTLRGALKTARTAVTTRLRGMMHTGKKSPKKIAGSDERPTTPTPTTYQPTTYQALAVGDRIRSSVVGEQGTKTYEFPEGKTSMGEIVQVNEGVERTYNIVYDDGDEALEAREFLQGKMLIQKLDWTDKCPHPTKEQAESMIEKIQNLLKVLEAMRDLDFHERKEPRGILYARGMLVAAVTVTSVFERPRDSDMMETVRQITDPKKGDHEGDGEPAMTKLARRIMMRLTAIMRTLAFANIANLATLAFSNIETPNLLKNKKNTNLLNLIRAESSDLQFLSFCNQQVGGDDYRKLLKALADLKLACAVLR